MKKMFKMVALMLALVLSLSMLAGCGADTSDKNENGQTVISVGDWPDKEGVALDTINLRKARFEEENPDVVIEPDLWKFDRKTFYAKASGGQLPTIFKGAFTEVPEIINMEYSEDLTAALKKHGFDGAFNERILDIISNEDGNIVVFPTKPYILGIAFNVDLLKAAGYVAEDGTPHQPKDWNEMVEMAVKIKEVTGVPGLVIPTAARNGGWIFTSLAWSFGVDFMEKDADGKWKATFNTPEAAEALQFVKDLKWKYDVLPANALIDYGEWYKTLGVGGAAMTITAGDYPGKVAKYGMQPEQVGMMAIPAGPKRHVTLLGGEIWSVKAGATKDQVDASVRWLKSEFDHVLTDTFKKTTEESVAKAIKENQHVGIQSLSQWNNDAESLKWYNEYIAEKSNGNPNHVRLYNEFVSNCPVEIQPEEPVCCQELYSILDGCIQEVLTNKDADVVAILEKANSDFQTNQLDNLSY
ncbi:MAG: extracellular solute-binding protein [Clostridia bacterium]|nr:extracellular solute-binding protein [Clostridia bacterium]